MSLQPVEGIRTSATVKARYLLATIDKAATARPRRAKIPAKSRRGDNPRTELLRTGGSPSSAGNGSAYSRSLLERISADGGFDLENRRNYHMDSVLECKLRLWQGGDPI
jgi:hypothetical protein